MLSLKRCSSHCCNDVLEQRGVATGCAVLAEVEVFFGTGPLSRILVESSREWVPIRMVFYIIPPFS